MPLAFGRVSGFRGNRGEVTVKVASGDAARWVDLRQVILRPAGGTGGENRREIETIRAYRDRLVVKFVGVDDSGRAEALRGYDVCARAEDVPPLPDAVYWVARLVGSRVQDVGGATLGRVEDVIETGGADLLLVKDALGVEMLIPLAQEIVTAVDEAEGTIVVSLPPGLKINAVDQEPA
jgi:16S rRNA processing protein RimM